jgi:ligand-binding sensor domain-containing protein
MKRYFYQTQAFTFLTILIVGTACNGQVKKDLPKDHPKLIKTIGSPKYGNVQCSLQDKAGNLWFGTTENGLYKYDARLNDEVGQGKSFRQFLVADGLNSNNIFSILEDKDGKIWIGTAAGVCLYDGKTFTKIMIPVPKNLPPNSNKFHKTQYVFSIMQAKSGKLWFATIDGVYIYDGKSLPTGQAGFTPFIINGATGGYLTSNNDAERILEDKAGNIWFGGRGNEGVFRYDGKSVINIKIKEPSSIRSDSDRISNDWAWPQLQDKNGDIWFSNWGGAYRYDGKSFTSFTKKDGLAGGVTRIIEDKKGNLWFGGDAGAGLSRYDGKSFTRFTTKDGLLNNSIWSILEDKTGNLWVGTRETGLCLYDGKTFITYSEYKHQPVTD